MRVVGRLFTDGGSRGNPGESGLGFVLTTKDAQVDGGWYLEQATNNVAEYSALLWGLKNALACNIDVLEIFADSELMVKQLNGAYKVKSEGLKPLYQQAKNLLSQFESASIQHVYREENKVADLLANEAMDAKGPVGSYKIPWEEQPQSLFDISDQLDDAETEEEIPPQSKEGETMIERNLPYQGEGTLSGKSYEDKTGSYELTVRDHFDAAHTLPGYPGACQYLHGHTWDVEISIEGQMLNEVGLLYDFKDIKKDLKSVLENFDHRYINDVPPFDKLSPTAEHISRVLFYELQEKFPQGIKLKEVAIWESPAARVAYRPL